MALDTLERIRAFERVVKPSDPPNSDIFNCYRLIILKGLEMGEFVSFQLLKEMTGMQSAGNLASHLKTLEKLGLITYHREHVGRRNLAFYEITHKGLSELQTIEEFLDIVFRGLKRRG